MHVIIWGEYYTVQQILGPIKSEYLNGMGFINQKEK